MRQLTDYQQRMMPTWKAASAARRQELLERIDYWCDTVGWRRAEAVVMDVLYPGLSDYPPIRQSGSWRNKVTVRSGRRIIDRLSQMDAQLFLFDQHQTADSGTHTEGAKHGD